MSVFRAACLAFGVALVAGCGTTYELTEVTDADRAAAASVLQQEAQLPAEATFNADQKIRNFDSAVRRTVPVAERFCRSQVEQGTPCDVTILVDDRDQGPANAYQYYRNGRPVIEFNLAMLAEARNQDEIAFIIGHEMGHHIASHLEKQEQQAMAGALIIGMAAAYAGASDYTTPQYVKQQQINDAVAGGAALGRIAYSQTYELEADMLGALIAAQAGYDPEQGARIFARRQPARNVDSSLSFWGTHPPSSERVALVAATARSLRDGGVVRVKE